MRRIVPVLLTLLVAHVAEAHNPAEGAQHVTEEDYLLKVNVACGTQLTITYDAESLGKHNSDIAHDQTGGSNECNESLRYIWYACRSEPGKAAIKAAHITRLVCRGTPGKVGSLSVSQGTITIERAFEEDKAFVRARKQFEAALRYKLPIQTEDPYYDEDWQKLKQQENPVLSTTTYCMVNGEKKKYEEYVYDSFIRRKEDATVKCWLDGQVTIDLKIAKGVHTGYYETRRDKSVSRRAYRNGKEHGEQRVTDDGKLRSQQLFDDGKQVSSTDYHPNGKLSRYSRHLPDRIDSVAYMEDGRMSSISCSPQVRDDKALRKPCGFEGAVTHQLYDGTGKIARVVTYKDGVLQKQAAGTSDYGSGSTVAYVDGKMHGEERVVDKTGKLKQLTTWSHGVRDGREQFFAEDGKKVTKEIIWKAGQMQKLTELYLNGNPKLRETYESPTKKRHEELWDIGKPRAEVMMVACERSRWNRDTWCEDGVGKTWHENGQLESETQWKLGKRHGAARRFYDNGKPHSVEEYAEDKLTKAKRWEVDGKLATDEEYEADGSRKIRR